MYIAMICNFEWLVPVIVLYKFTLLLFLLLLKIQLFQSVTILSLLLIRVLLISVVEKEETDQTNFTQFKNNIFI